MVQVWSKPAHNSTPITVIWLVVSRFDQRNQITVLCWFVSRFGSTTSDNIVLSCEQVGSTNQSDNGIMLVWAGWSKPAHNQSDNIMLSCEPWINKPIRLAFVELWALVGSKNLLTTQHNAVIWLVELIQTCSQLNIIPLSDWFVDPNLLRLNIIPLSDWFVDPNLLTTQHNTNQITVLWLPAWLAVIRFGSKPAHNST